MYVGARIRLRRNMLHISQTRMAERIGVTFQQVQKYERGMNRIGSSRLLQICDVLQVTPAWLFEGAPGPKAKSTAAARQVDAALAAFQTDNLAPPLMTVWTRLPVEMKRSMIALMTALADARTENK
jgi:transcriptional regulator with XRE-family HTH domain